MTPTTYPVAERFRAPQGEGLYTGTPTAFVRLVGCSVGKTVCTHCDTEFDRVDAALGGGLYTAEELATWALPFKRVCLTGGEPLDRDIRPLLEACTAHGLEAQIETSGTRHPDWLDPRPSPRQPGQHALGNTLADGRMNWQWRRVWVTVSPKPGFSERMVIDVADEIKVIVGGLGDGPGWPGIEDALRWADAGKLVYVQPRNFVHLVAEAAMESAVRLVERYPQLRLSMQAHKFLKTR